MCAYTTCSTPAARAPQVYGRLVVKELGRLLALSVQLDPCTPAVPFHEQPYMQARE